MNSVLDIAPETFGLKNLSGSIFYRSIEEVDRDRNILFYAHYMRRAFDTLGLDGILCLDGKPTVFLRNFTQPVTRQQINKLHQQCWNQGVATVLVVQDPHQVYLFSVSARPSNASDNIDSHSALLEVLKRSAEVLESYQLVSKLASGFLYRSKKELFRPDNSVDRYLIDNLGAVCDVLCPDDKTESMQRVHAFMGRLIFTCYLIDRKIIKLPDYHFVSRDNVCKLIDIFEVYSADKAKEILYNLFRSLWHDSIK